MRSQHPRNCKQGRAVYIASSDDSPMTTDDDCLSSEYDPDDDNGNTDDDDEDEFQSSENDEENLSTSRSKQANIFKKGSFYTINDFSGEYDLIVFINKGDA